MNVHPITNPDIASLSAATQGDAVQQRRDTNSDKCATRAFERFTEWCAENTLTARPTSEQTVLRYFHSHYPNWAPGNLIYIKKVINANHRVNGYDAPCQRRTRLYINGVKAEGLHQSRPASDARDPLRISDADAMLNIPPRIVEPVRNMQSLTQAAYDTRLPVRILASLVGGHITVNPGLAIATVTPDNQTPVTVNQRQHPATYATLNTAANHPTHRIWSTPPQHTRRNTTTAAHRIGLPDPWTTPGAYTSLTPHEMDLHIAVLNWETQRVRWRDDALILIGVLCAFRYSDVEPQRIETTRRTDYGYDLFIPYSKTDVVGQGRHVHLTHPDRTVACHPVSPCDPLCPVAAIDRLLYAERIVRNRTSGWLIIADRTGQTPLITKQASNILRARATQAGIDPTRFSSRSLRVGGATTAHEQGWPIREIAEQLTFHRDARQTAVYIRHSNNRRPIYLDPLNNG